MKRLSWRFPVMQIAFINQWMLFWPALLIVVYALPLMSTHKIWTYIREVVAKWILAYTLFMVFYLGFGYISGTREADFDPSGHMACALAAQGSYFSPYLFFVKQNVLKRASSDEPIKCPMEKATRYIYIGTLVHACYSLFFAAFIFHTVLESMIGWFFGMLIAVISYETDLFSDAVYQILKKPLQMCKK